MYRFTLTLILFLLPILAYGQFIHRFEFSVSVEAFQQIDLNNIEKFGIEYHEDNSRTGAGFNTGFRYVFDHIPFSVSAQYSHLSGNQYAYDTNILTFERGQAMTINSTSLIVNLDLFRSSSFSPYLYGGVNLISMNLKRADVENLAYMHDDFTIPIIWEFESIEAQINTVGFLVGTGLKYRINDKTGVYIDICFNPFSQDITSWLGDKASIRSLRLGTYFRFSKRKRL